MPHCRTYWLIVFMLFALCVNLKADNTLTSATVDSTSYQLYMSKQWQLLTKFCDKAIKEGYDYYYLRMRAGIACYELKNYRKAIGHFRRALAFNSNDETADAYLYYSYIYAGRFEEARNFTRFIDSTTKTNMGIGHLQPIAFVGLEGAVKLSDSSAKFKPVNYIQLNLQHYVGNRVSLYHALTYYKQNESRNDIKQFQYYLSATVPLKRTTILTVGTHMLYDKLSIPEVTTKTVNPTGPSPQPTIKTYTNYIEKQSMGLVAAATITKRMTYLDVSLGTTVSFFDTTTQYQFHAGLTCYPFGNRKLAFGALLYHHSEDYYKNSAFAITPFLSSCITKKLLLSASYLNNRGGNINENSGYFVNNSLDLSTSRIACTAEYNLFKKVNVYATYGYESKQEKFYHYTYHYNTFLIGIKIIP